MFGSELTDCDVAAGQVRLLDCGQAWGVANQVSAGLGYIEFLASACAIEVGKGWEQEQSELSGVRAGVRG